MKSKHLVRFCLFCLGALWTAGCVSPQTPLTGDLQGAGHEDGQMVFVWKE